MCWWQVAYMQCIRAHACLFLLALLYDMNVAALRALELVQHQDGLMPGMASGDQGETFARGNMGLRAHYQPGMLCNN